MYPLHHLRTALIAVLFAAADAVSGRHRCPQEIYGYPFASQLRLAPYPVPDRVMCRRKPAALPTVK